MLSKDANYRLDHAVTDDKVGDEIAARLISATPADDAAAQAILNILDTSDKMNKSIAERLYTGLAGDHDGAAGKEISQKLIAMVAVLKAAAAADDAAVVAAQAAMGSESMSASTYDCLKHAMGDEVTATEIRTAYDAMIVAVQAIVVV
jgi:hypothetical protein